ncbi:acyltransferase [Enterococcus casseliflavus]|uniref:Acyltransferase n=1 Tax=Enterococcus casseliflavus TaxID=37734 RepID=A0ABD6YYF2_ENTCA|nr:DapH/DapD/GlmU-related protein [Enterococcus casseliflavus]EOH84874.1 hypothetical protein UAM_00539 [Enterococcus casseliflavus ATCC 49996]EOU10613.1 hypothetical protein I582_01126 [Enterococcus casseliflavus ATCC 49996]QGN29036.1 acyltransferase [Enterococcus casseliflavus]QQB84483.1 acyltransferase [Enterococcus casseliflavus]
MWFHKQIRYYDKVIIIKNISKKLFRGILKSVFLGKVSGFVFIGKNVRISHAKNIFMGKNVKLEDYVEVHGLSRDGIILEDNVTISRGTMIRPSSYYGKDLGRGVYIGKNSSIGPHGYIGCSGKITIGENVMLGPKCSLFAENHVFSDNNSTIKSQGVRNEGITIEDDCWIGSNVIILDGVTIGKGSVIAAGAVITKSIPQRSLVIDKKNKQIRSRVLEQDKNVL